jgi:hypothetical protein
MGGQLQQGFGDDPGLWTSERRSELDVTRIGIAVDSQSSGTEI